MSDQTPAFTDPDRSSHGAFVVDAPQGVHDFVALHVRSGANQIGQEFVVDLRLEVDEWRLRVERKPGMVRRAAGHRMTHPSSEPLTIDLRISLRRRYVRSRCDGVALLGDSK